MSRSANSSIIYSDHREEILEAVGALFSSEISFLGPNTAQTTTEISQTAHANGVVFEVEAAEVIEAAETIKGDPDQVHRTQTQDETSRTGPKRPFNIKSPF